MKHYYFRNIMNQIYRKKMESFIVFSMVLIMSVFLSLLHFFGYNDSMESNIANTLSLRYEIKNNHFFGPDSNGGFVNYELKDYYDEFIEFIEKVEENDVVSKGTEVAELAQKYLGYKYVVGGKNPESGFDCSGFTRYIFLQFNHSLGSTAAGQNNVGIEVSREDLKAGDLILFYDEAKTKIGHTGIYISDGNFVHSANPERGVVIDNINTNSYYNERYIVAKRIVE